MLGSATASSSPPGYALPWPLVRAQLLRGAGFVLLLCLAIALLLTAAGRSGLGDALLHSLLIGLCCWLLIDGGRHLLSHLRLRARAWRGLCLDLPVGLQRQPACAGAGADDTGRLARAGTRSRR